MGRAPNFLDLLEAERNGKEGPLRKSRCTEEKITLVSKPTHIDAFVLLNMPSTLRLQVRPSNSSSMNRDT